jgi:hypothetical protein
LSGRQATNTVHKDHTVAAAVNSRHATGAGLLGHNTLRLPRSLHPSHSPSTNKIGRLDWYLLGLGEMGGGILETGPPHVRSGQHQLDVLLAPAGSRGLLQPAAPQQAAGQSESNIPPIRREGDSQGF